VIHYPELVLDVGTGELIDGVAVPGHGLPETPGNRLTAWARLSHGRAIGKKEILAYDRGDDDVVQEGMTSILDIGGRAGDDDDACQLAITLSQPRVLNKPFATHGIGDFNQQNLTGSYDNIGIATGNFPGTGAPIAWVPITAIVEWGLGGTSHRAFVDFVQGATINLVASWLRVHAAVAPDAENVVRANSAWYEVAANVGPGWPRPGIAQRTVYLGTVVNGADSGTFAIPPFAKSAQVICMDPGATPSVTSAFLRFWQGPTGVAAGDGVGNYFQSGNQPLGFPIPNGAGYFSVLSNYGADARFAVLFDLAI